MLQFNVALFAQKTNPKKNAIDDVLSFHLLDVESGLSDNYINSIEQDSLGFIWIATADGLNRYDGNLFINYRNNSLNGLTNNNIVQIKQHINNKEIILATDEGLNKYIPKLEKFEAYYKKNNSLNKFINCFTIDPHGNLIFSTLRSNEGLHIIDKNGIIESFKHDPNNNESLSSNEISSLAMQHDSTLWIGTFHGGVNKMNYSTKKITRVGENNKSFSKSIKTIYIDLDDNIWIGSKEGIQVITKKRDTLSLKSSMFPGKGLSDNNVLCFEEDNHGRIWIGTRNGGLNVLDKSSFLIKDKKLSIKWFLPKTDGTSVYNRTVSCIKKDTNGNMWLGTSTGVNYVNPKDEPVKILQNNASNSQTISHNRIGSLALASDDKIWIGTDGGGLDLFNPENGKITHYKHSEKNQKSLSNNYIISVLEDSNKRVWAGTYQGGLNLLNPTSGNSKKYLINDDIRVIFEDSSKQIWIGTNRGGLFKLNEEKDSFEYITILGQIDIRDIEQDAENNLWLATSGDGIIRYNTKKNDVHYYNTTNTDGLQTNVFFSILPLADGDLLLGSRYKGLIRLHPKTKSISIFTEENGLSNNTVNSIVKENNDFIWLGTSNGINRYNINNNKTYNLSTLNNIQTSSFNIGAAVKSKKGLLYFGGNKGLNVFYPKRLEKEKNDYKLIFQNILVFNKSVPINTEKKKGVLNQSISYEDQINFNHKQTLFSIGFTVLKYPEAKNINYSYLLEGYQKHWIKLEGLGLATFSNTPPGNYTLKVKATMDSGEEITNRLLISISPPFWKTLPAYLLYLLLFSIVFVLALKYYSERIKLKNSLLFEKKQRQLEHDLNEERIHFFTNFSHELKTPLTLILAPLDDLIHQLKLDKHLKSVHLIKRNAITLYKSINKLLQFRKSETGLSQLLLEKQNISSFLTQTKIDFSPLAKKNKITLSLSLPKENIIAGIDVDKFQIIINNLISNAFKHCKEKAEIKITLTLKNEFFKISVRDTGSGIDKNDLPYIFDWYYQSGKSSKNKGVGIGLALTKSFVELHKGTIYAKNNSSSTGVTFTLEIPRKEALFPTLSENNDVDKTDNVWKTTPVNYINDEKFKKIKIKQNRKLILLVDDNPDILQYLESILENEYDLIFSYDGKDGIDKAIKYIPDIIISDIMMPLKSGVDLCHHLKNQMSTTHIPIILLSAKDSNESIKTGFEEGADAYITKPFNGEILLSRIKNLLRSRDKLKEYFFSKEATLPELSSTNLKLLDKEKIFLRKLKTIILNNLKTENATVDAIAKDIGMSRSSLFRKIKAITGKNINEYIRKVRIEKAAYLIKEEDTTISQAAYEVGFNSINYFRRVFKEELGELPSKYKNKNK
jgi:ligand-binding sensor domain-containing protein/signal transduction histidine kinase/DNA-binding response OmpR family regulator